MAVTLDATPSGANSNSYATVAQGDDYFNERLDAAAWNSAVADDKARALIMGTARLEDEAWQGWPTLSTQRLAWPRGSTYDRDDSLLDHETIPDIVKRGLFELALALLRDPDLLDDVGLEAFESIGLGSLDVVPRGGFRAGKLPATVARILDPVRWDTHGRVWRA